MEFNIRLHINIFLIISVRRNQNHSMQSTPQYKYECIMIDERFIKSWHARFDSW